MFCILCIDLLIDNTLLFKSISDHFNAHSSPIRSPVYRQRYTPSLVKSKFESKNLSNLNCSETERTFIFYQQSYET